MHRFRNSTVVVLIVAMAIVQQGCIAAAWVAAVCVDSMRASDVRFEPFEASWISPERPATVGHHTALKRVALIPLDGDEAMNARLRKLLVHETTLQVVTPETWPSQVTGPRTDGERAMLSRELSHEFDVDAVLYGHVVCTAPHSATWGRKTQESRRLFLYLIDRDGNLLWKDELPFQVVTGEKPALEESIQLALTRHFMDHVHALRLDEAGYFPAKPS